MKKSAQSNQDDKKLFAWLATFLSLIGFIIALIARRNDKYVMYYTKQSIVIFILGAILGFIQPIVEIIPFIGKLVNAAMGILIFVVWIFSWVHALSGKEKEIPIISDWAKKIKL
jgi:uncharacterized membrane protein